MDKDQCRLCGKSLNFADLMEISPEIIEKVQYFCRIQLIFSERYPQKMCYNCNYTIENFSTFTENLKETQLKFSALFQNIKIEIDELPALIQQSTDINILDEIDEPKVEINEDDDEIKPLMLRKKKIKTQQPTNKPKHSKMDVSNSEESTADSGSDSDYDGNKYYKRKRPIKHRRVRMKKSTANNVDDENEIFEEIPESDRYKNGSIKKKSLLLYEGNSWNDVKVTCVECNENFNGPVELRNHHFKSHSLDTQYKCSECAHKNDVNFSYFYQFLNHYPEHQKHLKFCCVLCPEMFWNTKSLNQHYENSHDKSHRTAIFHCMRCGQYFRKSFDLINHESRYHNVESPSIELDSSKVSSLTMEVIFEDEMKCAAFEQKSPFQLSSDQKNADGSVTSDCKELYTDRMWNNIGSHQCTHCGIQTGTSVYHLYEHYNAQHQDVKNSYVCKSCPEHKIFLNLESFVNHTFTIHHEHLRYFCFICHDGYWDYKALYHHYKKDHEDYKAFICLYCGKYHKSVYDIRHHKEVHLTSKAERDGEAKSFTCSMCPKSFSRQNQLQRHMDSHTKNEGKVWICETCGKSFNAKSTLINHAMVHQTEKPFVCTVCGEGFKNKYKLKHHKGIHTGERNFGCEICGQRFRAKGTLKGHILTHTGERPFSCEFCDKRFAAKYDLLVHTRLHTGEFTHECQICHERYPSWSNYSKHMRGRHQIDPRSEKKKKYDAIAKSFQEGSKNEAPAEVDPSLQFYNI